MSKSTAVFYRQTTDYIAMNLRKTDTYLGGPCSLARSRLIGFYSVLSMGAVSLLAFLVLCHLVHAEDFKNFSCPKSFQCGKFRDLSFPFTNSRQPHCGFFGVSECDDAIQMILLKVGGRVYEVENISLPGTIAINDSILQKNLDSKNCQYFEHFDFLLDNPNRVFHYHHNNLTIFKCNHSSPTPSSHNLLPVECSSSYGYNLYYKNPQDNGSSSLGPPYCSVIQMPLKSGPPPMGGDLFTFLAARFYLQVQIADICVQCFNKGGMCQPAKNGSFDCVVKGKSRLKLILGLCLGASVIAFCLMFYLVRRRYKHKYSSEYMSRNISSDPSSTSDLEGGSVCCGVHTFSYAELEEATNNFKECNEIGDGGFGAVYYGKLRDGREVAVKRLYQHNSRRLQQFKNEIEILTCLRHKNLVSLYGCTSHRSRDLLLVYEFIPNGTLAHHLHGEGSNTGSMTWPIRMSIALETASALAYLHASDTIHRDVKTDNILLDNNFSVKVADFGLSRLFPNDVTHVSTAPQGTPGYVDPEYHQYYQLTDKSDVYSFGVVLIELISSMPAVDISRHRHDINLSNFAMSRIQRRAFNELVDPSLGFDSDEGIKTAIMQVAEVAFRCLQQDKEMRPDMKEIVQHLKAIEKGGELEVREEIADAGDDNDNDNDGGELKSVKPPPSPDCCDEAGLLKNEQALPVTEYDGVRLGMKGMRPPPSPVSVTDRWVSNTTTPNPSS